MNIHTTYHMLVWCEGPLFQAAGCSWTQGLLGRVQLERLCLGLRGHQCVTLVSGPNKKRYPDIDSMAILKISSGCIYRLLIGEQLALPLSTPHSLLFFPAQFWFLYRHRRCSLNAQSTYFYYQPTGWYRILTVAISWQGESFEH